MVEAWKLLSPFDPGRILGLLFFFSFSPLSGVYALAALCDDRILKKGPPKKAKDSFGLRDDTVSIIPRFLERPVC